MINTVEVHTFFGHKIAIWLHIVGDSAYVANETIQYSPALTQQQKCFTFGCLKAKWRHLMKINGMTTDHIPTIIFFCMLHTTQSM